MRRLKLLKVAPDVLVSFWVEKGTFKIEGESIPKDARLVRCDVEPRSTLQEREPPQTILIVMEHPSFDEVPEGAEIPEAEPVCFKRIEA